MTEETGNTPSEAPVAVLRGSRLITREWSPNRILLFEDRIEEHDLGFLKKTVQSLRYGQVARVSLFRGMLFTELRIESTGGQEIEIQGLRNARAEEAKRLIEERVARAVRPAEASSPVTPEERLRALTRLHDEGVITEAEFERKRREIVEGL